MVQAFWHLFTPLEIRSITIRNRIVLPAHVTMYGQNHLPTERTAYYLAERAKGGVGLIVSELTAVLPNSLSSAAFLAGFDERAIPGFRLIADMVHEHGVRIVGQLAHMGRQSAPHPSTKLPLWAPSPVPSPIIRETPHAMTVNEIQEVKEGFVKSASNLQVAGYDGIEIHGAHGYLINQFMSPFTNYRTDAYGGNLENRLRFALEVIAAVREQIGDNMVLGIRISGDELVPGGLTLNDMREIAARLEGTGKIDYISVSVGIHETDYVMIGDMSVPLGAIAYLAAGIKEVVNLPVLAVLRINDPVQAEQILAEGKADMIGMCRALICDPELPNKAREGRLNDIRKCIACNQECRRADRGPVRCTLNPTVGFEKELGIGTIKPAATKKKVVIIGGGPAGLEAARIAAIRGHKVTLYEKRNELGGQIIVATKVPSRSELGESIRYLSYQLRNLGVDIKLGAEATTDSILREKPDAVVVATGSKPLMRDIPGAAEGSIRITNVQEVLEERIDTGDNVVIFDYPAGFWQCCSTAEFVATKGKKVTIVTPLPFIGMSIPFDSLHGVYQRLLTQDVIFIPNSDIRAIKGSSLIIHSLYSDREQYLEKIDSLILSLGGQANDALYHELSDKVKEVYLVGDCVAPRKIPDAIHEGHRIGRRI
jgi:mycofactocin system FadH/OYE family oxidoreductase 2